MNFLQILDCSNVGEIIDILRLVRFAINAICWAVPIIIIILTTIDVAKVVTAGNLDDKLKKEVGQKITTRLIYAIVIFLIPTIVTLLFRLLGNNNAIDTGSLESCTWSEAWSEAAK